MTLRAQMLAHVQLHERLLVGREREGAEVRRLLSSTRLATLTALVGVSKTRLAL